MEHTLLKLQKFTYSKDVNNYYPEILSDEAHNFLIALHEKFNAERLELLNRRIQQQNVFDKGQFPEFPIETKEIRNAEWTAGNIPHDLQDRRVEITGPVDRKMIINALNSGAKTFMADLEDSNSPTWNNSIQGQQNLIDANKEQETAVVLSDESLLVPCLEGLPQGISATNVTMGYPITSATVYLSLIHI